MSANSVKKLLTRLTAVLATTAAATFGTAAASAAAISNDCDVYRRRQ